MEKNKTKQKNPKKGQDKNRMFKLFGIFSLIILLPLVSSVTYTSPEDVYSDFNWIDYDDANVEANYGGIDFTYGDSNNLVGYIRPTISPGLNTSLLFGVASGSSTSTILSLIGSTGYVGIGTTAPFQKLHVNGSILANGTISSSKLAINNNNTPLYFLTVGNQSATNYSLVSAYFEGNITSAGYITRTSTFDSSKNVWDYVKDATFYKTDNIIDDTKFYGYTTWNTYQIDYSNIVQFLYLRSLYCDSISIAIDNSCCHNTILTAFL